jgi:hypothetical protein
MPSGSAIAEYIVAHFPRLAGRVQLSGTRQRQQQLNEQSHDSFNTHLVTAVLGVSQLRPPEVTILDTTRQILDLQQRKTWKTVIES